MNPVIEPLASRTRKTLVSAKTEKEIDFHGAAYVDADGNEIPITEEMIQQACMELESSWHFPGSQQA